MKNKDAYYFPHDSNARNDYKLLRLRAKFGWEGYGIYFAIIEILREQSDYKLGKESSEAIATAIGKPFEWIQDFVNNLIQLGLLSREDGGGLYSESLINRMQQYEDRKMMLSEAGKKGAKIKKLKRLNRLKPPLSIKENKIKENKIKIYNNKEGYFLEIFEQFNFNNLEVTEWIEWCNYRKEIKKKMTERTVKNQLKFLSQQPNPAKCIEQSIKNGWTGLFEEKNNNGTNNKSGGASPEFLRELITNRESKERNSN